MESFFKIALYEYSSFSWSGIEESESLYFKTEQAAIDWAAGMCLTIVEHCVHPSKEATLEKVSFIG